MKKIIFSDDENKRAVAVEFVKDGKNVTVYATKEIILSAGVFGTPHLLMLSGIGPRQHLEKFGVSKIKTNLDRIAEFRTIQQYFSLLRLFYIYSNRSCV